MTIQEALKSGKPFRRKGWTDWYKRDGVAYINLSDRREYRDVHPDDILADDWEVRNESVTLYVPCYPILEGSETFGGAYLTDKEARRFSEIVRKFVEVIE